MQELNLEFSALICALFLHVVGCLLDIVSCFIHSLKPNYFGTKNVLSKLPFNESYLMATLVCLMVLFCAQSGVVSTV